MGQRYSELQEKQIEFIKDQKIFFVATAGKDGSVNLSPKGDDSLRVLGANRVVWLNLTGSGNESSGHVQQNSRMTIMFCSFKGKPLILRLYGIAQVIHPGDPQWDELKNLFPVLAGTRQFFDMRVDLVQTSCGMGVPLYDFVKQRDMLEPYWKKRGPENVKQYWKDKNKISIDGEQIKI